MLRKQFAARVWAKLKEFERREGLLRRGDRVLAAVSGGPDSVCLAHFLSVQARAKGFSLRLAHIHHGLRGREADRDAESVRRLGARLGLQVLTKRLDVLRAAAKRRRGKEDAARHLRYGALARLAREHRCGKVATGHQLDDQAETVLLHLLRGTRLEGLAGIPVRRPLARGIELVRPLLPITRKEVDLYLKMHGLRGRLDRTNLSQDFTRNWVRLKVIPMLEKRNPRIREHLDGIAAQVAQMPGVDFRERKSTVGTWRTRRRKSTPGTSTP
ncbi:MAG: tRNA lysidine(34) synthetase TilS [Elusimicrobia bacterium]|nr:tRNA lysidine(34) synthetase TilS [Elusimicrobiota bacterium]